MVRVHSTYGLQVDQLYSRYRLMNFRVLQSLHLCIFQMSISNIFPRNSHNSLKRLENSSIVYSKNKKWPSCRWLITPSLHGNWLLNHFRLILNEPASFLVDRLMKHSNAQKTYPFIYAATVGIIVGPSSHSSVFRWSQRMLSFCRNSDRNCSPCFCASELLASESDLLWVK